MEHAAVVAGLVGRELRFLLDDGQPQVRAAFEEAVCRGQPDDPATDDHDVAAVRHPGDVAGNGMP